MRVGTEFSVSVPPWKTPVLQEYIFVHIHESSKWQGCQLLWNPLSFYVFSPTLLLLYFFTHFFYLLYLTLIVPFEFMPCFIWLMILRLSFIPVHLLKTNFQSHCNGTDSTVLIQAKLCLFSDTSSNSSAPLYLFICIHFIYFLCCLFNHPYVSQLLFLCSVFFLLKCFLSHVDKPT